METEIMTRDQWENTKDIVTKCFSTKFVKFSISPLMYITPYIVYDINSKNFDKNTTINTILPHALSLQNTFQIFFLFYLKKINIDINKFLNNELNLQSLINEFLIICLTDDKSHLPKINEFIEKLGTERKKIIHENFLEYVDFSIDYLKHATIDERILGKTNYYKGVFYGQTTNNYWICFAKNDDAQLIKDYDRSRYIPDETKRLASLSAITMFYKHEYFYSNEIPNWQTLRFWLYIDCFLNNEQRNKLSYILNTDEKNLTEEQIKLKHLLNDPNFQAKFIEFCEASFKIDSDEPYNESHLPDKNHLQKILLFPDKNLTPNEIAFKDIYLARLTKIYSDVFTEIMQRNPEPNEIPEHLYLANFILEKNDGSLIPENLRESFKTKIQKLGIDIEKDELISGKTKDWISFPEPKSFDEIQFDEKPDFENIFKILNETKEFDKTVNNDVIEEKTNNFFESFGNKYIYEKGNGFLKYVGSGLFNSADTNLVVFLTMQKLSVCYPTKQSKILSSILRSNQLSSALKNQFQVELQNIKNRKTFFKQVFNGNFNSQDDINNISLNLSKCCLRERFLALNLLFSHKSKLSDIHKENLRNSDVIKSLIQNEFVNEKGNGFLKAVSLGIFNSIEQNKLCEAIEQKLSVYPKSKQRKISVSLTSNKSKLPNDIKNFLLVSKTEPIPKSISINENTPLLQ